MAGIRDAPSPFNKTRADVVLRTCDGVDFRVRSSIIGEASTVLQDIFDVAQANKGRPRKDGRPVVCIDEPSEVTEPVLRLCYPVANPTFTRFSDVRAVLAAVDKYMMDGAMDAMKTHLIDFSLEGADPLLTFAVAQRYGFEDVARIVAEETIGRPLTHVWIEDLEDLTAGAYYRLLQFRGRGDKAASATPFFSAPRPRAASRSRPVPFSKAEWSSESPYPFGLSSADLALHTVDGVTFRVHSSILQIASPYFQCLFVNPPQPKEPCERDSQGRVVALQLEEHSRTIAALLHYIYPVRRLKAPADPHAAARLLKVAKKYEVSVAVDPLRTSFLGFADAEPLVVYAIACAHHWRPEARDAAKLSLCRPLGYVEEFEDVSAGCYYRLAEYRKMAGRAARERALSYLGWAKGELKVRANDEVEDLVWVSCRSCEADNAVRLRKWWCGWLRQVAGLLLETPCGQTVFASRAFESALRGAAGCTTCRSVAAVHLHYFGEMLAETIEHMLAGDSVELEVL